MVIFENLGQEINFNFDVDREAIVGYHSCGAWLNGEYYIIDGTRGKGVIRTVKTCQ